MMALDKQARAIQKLSTSNRLNLQKKEAVQREFSRLHACTVVNFLLGALVSTAVLAAQEPPKNTTSESGTVLRQTVRRVRVDVVVTDPQGHTIRDLHASDFHVSEDGAPQTIRQFEYHTDEDVEAALPKRPALPPHTFMNMPAAPERGPLMVVLYDVLNTQVADQLSARAQMLKFLQKSAGRRIAIFFLGDRLRLLQGFTSDTDLLVQAVSQTGASSLRGYQAELTGYPTTETNLAGTPSGGSGGRMTDAQAFEKRSADMKENARQAEASQLLTDRVETTLIALGEIGRFLEGLPGRKNLIWYSGSFPAYISSNPTRQYASIQPGSLVRDDSARTYTERIRKVINLLNTAEVAIYPVDARGLLTDYPPLEIKTAEFSTMNLLGDQTGGKAFYGTNALEEALDSAADDGSSYYSLVYAPTNGKFNGSVRRISVRLRRGQYHLAYRRSYIADDAASTPRKQNAAEQDSGSPHQTPASVDSTAADSQFGAPLSHQLIFAVHVDTIGAPSPATADQMAALAPYQEQAAKIEHKKFVPASTPVSMQQYAIGYAVLASQLDIPKSANGVYHTDLSMAALAFNEEGATLLGTKTRLKDDIPASKIGNIREDGFQAVQTVFVPVDTAVIRIVVCDEHSARVGSMEVRLPLPPDQNVR